MNPVRLAADLCVCVCTVMSQEVEPCEHSNIHWGLCNTDGGGE